MFCRNEIEQGFTFLPTATECLTLKVTAIRALLHTLVLSLRFWQWVLDFWCLGNNGDLSFSLPLFISWIQHGIQEQKDFRSWSKSTPIGMWMNWSAVMESELLPLLHTTVMKAWHSSNALMLPRNQLDFWPSAFIRWPNQTQMNFCHARMASLQEKPSSLLFKKYFSHQQESYAITTTSFIHHPFLPTKKVQRQFWINVQEHFWKWTNNLTWFLNFLSISQPNHWSQYSIFQVLSEYQSWKWKHSSSVECNQIVGATIGLWKCFWWRTVWSWTWWKSVIGNVT